ncbi:hypothetical protein OE810_13120 [Rhodobacteraceae bacterium XHP0102]|nr:hypothetical protein [Rhodobacteraceae bacterium XHP0102]
MKDYGKFEQVEQAATDTATAPGANPGRVAIDGAVETDAARAYVLRAPRVRDLPAWLSPAEFFGSRAASVRVAEDEGGLEARAAAGELEVIDLPRAPHVRREFLAEWARKGGPLPFAVCGPGSSTIINLAPTFMSECD